MRATMTRVRPGERKHREHKPHVHGPRVWKPEGSRFYRADLRPWGGTRLTLRNPKAEGWPALGDRTEHEDVAHRWKWAYLDYVKGEAYDRQTGRTKGKPVRTAVEEYQAAQRRTLTRNTIRSTHAPLMALVARFKDRPTISIKPAELQRMVDELVEEGYRPQTVVFNAMAWRRLFRWLGGADPTKTLDLPSTDDVEQIHAWSYETWQKVRKRALGFREPALVQLLDIAVCTGGRINEVLALRGTDLKPQSGTVRFARQFEDSHAGPEWERVLKGKLARTALCLEELWGYGYNLTGNGYVTTRHGKPINSSWARKRIKLILNPLRMGGEGRAFHDCRRTYIRLWLERGAQMAEVQRWVGHATITTTEKNYPAFTAEMAAANVRNRLYGSARKRA